VKRKKMDEKEGDYVSSSENNSDSADIKHKKQKKNAVSN